MSKAEKQKLRDKVRDLRAGFDFATLAKLSQALQERLLESTLWKNAEIIGLYMPLPDEPDTKLLFAEAVSSGKLTIFPRCIESPMQGDENWMEFVPCACNKSFIGGKYGILEPDSSCQALLPGVEPFTPETRKTLLLVPGQLFDRQGWRLGRGGGYYDRWLAQPDLHGAYFLGYSFSFAVMDNLPREGHDARLHGLCTDKELICFKEAKMPVL